HPALPARRTRHRAAPSRRLPEPGRPCLRPPGADGAALSCAFRHAFRLARRRAGRRRAGGRNLRALAGACRMSTPEIESDRLLLAVRGLLVAKGLTTTAE